MGGLDNVLVGVAGVVAVLVGWHSLSVVLSSHISCMLSVDAAQMMGRIGGIVRSGWN